MNYGVYQVLDLSVFDKEGKFITQLNSLKESNLSLDGDGKLFVKDALLNMDFLKFMQDVKEDNITDYDRVLKLYETQTVTFNVKKSTKECKLLALTVARTQEENKDHVFMFEIPNAEIDKRFNMNISGENPSVFDALFMFKPYNDEGDIIKMHIHTMKLSIKG